MNILIIISGLFLTISLPPFSISFLAFVGLIPLLFSIKDKSIKDSFRIGYLAGVAHYFTLLYWIPYPITRYGNISIFLSIFPYILLCMYLALFFGIFCCLCNLKKEPAIILYPSYWVVLEFIRGKILTGFPWCLLGYSQYKNIHLIQIVDITGVYGISFLIIMMNVAIYHVLKKDIRAVEISLIIIVFLCTYGYGAYRLNHPFKGKKLISAIVQANIDQSVKWDTSYQEKTIKTYLELTSSCYKYKPKLIVWPETAVPFFFQDGGRLADIIWGISRESKASLLLGSPAYLRTREGIRYYNRAYMISYGHKLIFYDKVHLVPFGEYVPLKKILFFLNRLVPAAGDFCPGKKIIPLKNKDIKAGVMICFEAIFPEIARIHVKKGANILVNISNDAWFGRTSAPYQHFVMSIFRAVENRRALIRATNTGISAFIDPYGRIITKGGLYKKQVLISKTVLIDQYMSFYTCYGDIFVYALFLLTFFSIGGTILWQKYKEHL